MASRELRAGHLLLDAAKDSRLHPALQQIVANQPEFASWTPSSLCFYYMDAVKLGRRRVAEPDRRYQLLGVWTLATTLQEGGARRDLVVDMYASRNSLLRAAQAAEVRLHEAHSVVSDKADTTFDMYSIKIGRTLLVWSGRHTGDSTRVDQTIQEDWSVSGLRSNIRAARLDFQPAWSWPLIGSLRVEGKGDLAEALRSSPIRFVGPLYRGGGGHLRFFR
ncbi:MAG TPA: hypothetical protein VD930_02495 [Gemmatimonadales bacterium]|nr:hypothetical protein [Gemmatimonadales bacterium]